MSKGEAKKNNKRKKFPEQSNRITKYYSVEKKKKKYTKLQQNMKMKYFPCS